MATAPRFSATIAIRSGPPPARLISTMSAGAPGSGTALRTRGGMEGCEGNSIWTSVSGARISAHKVIGMPLGSGSPRRNCVVEVLSTSVKSSMVVETRRPAHRR